MQKEDKFKNFFIMALPFLVMVIPNLKIPIGSVPIYFNTLLIGFIWVYYYRKTSNAKLDPQILRCIIVYYLLTIVSAVFEMLKFKQVLQSTYMLIQYALSSSLLFTLPKLLETEEDIKRLFRWCFWALFVNTVVCIGFALPATGGYFQDILFSKSWLYPQKSRLVGYLELDREATARTFRGQTLFGNANVAGLTILQGIILAFAYFRFSTSDKRVSGFFLYSTVAAAIIALILTQSRSSYLAGLLVVLYLFFSKTGGRVRQYIIMGAIAGFIVITLFLSNSSSNIKFDRITKSFNMLAGEEELGYSEEARILSYTKFFGYLEEYPQFWLFGKGISGSAIARYTGEKDTDFSLKGGLNHFYFASVFYERGFLAALVFTIFLFLVHKKILFKPPLLYRESKFFSVSQVLLVSVIMPLLVTHYFTDDDQGAYLFFFIIALSLTISNIASNSQNANAKRLS